MAEVEPPEKKTNLAMGRRRTVLRSPHNNVRPFRKCGRGEIGPSFDADEEGPCTWQRRPWYPAPIVQGRLRFRPCAWTPWTCVVSEVPVDPNDRCAWLDLPSVRNRYQPVRRSRRNKIAGIPGRWSFLTAGAVGESS